MERKVMDAKIVDNNYNGNSRFYTLLLGIILFLCGACGMYYFMKYYPTETVINKLEKEVTVTETGIADAVEKVYDSVVVIENYKGNSIYATGTGFIYKKDGNKYYILTNYHVIDSSTKIMTVFTDNTKTPVEYIGGDKYSDIAVLAFESSKDFSIAEIGSSTDARLGDTVFAVGAPIDSSTYSWTVTRGILSGKDRMVSVSISSSGNNSNDYMMKLLQTDTAINSGNSGGPLCNSNGEVIGITNMKLSTSGSVFGSSNASIENMGFAIPVEDALDFAKRIIDDDDFTRPVLGVSMVSLEGAAYYKIDVPDNVKSGIVVSSVEKKSNAEAAGIKVGDVVLEFDNVAIDSSARLKYELYRHKIGDTVKIKINRDGVEKILEVTLKK